MSGINEPTTINQIKVQLLRQEEILAMLELAPAQTAEISRQLEGLDFSMSEMARQLVPPDKTWVAYDPEWADVPTLQFLIKIQCQLSHEQFGTLSRLVIREYGVDALLLTSVQQRIRLTPVQIDMLKDIVVERTLTVQEVMREQMKKRPFTGDEFVQHQQQTQAPFEQRMIELLTPYQKQQFEGLRQVESAQSNVAFTRG